MEDKKVPLATSEHREEASQFFLDDLSHLQRQLGHSLEGPAGLWETLPLPLSVFAGMAAATGEYWCILGLWNFTQISLIGPMGVLAAPWQDPQLLCIASWNSSESLEIQSS